MMIDIQAKQAEINGMNYGDARVLDLQMLYFGDEVHLYIEDYIGYEENTEECWKLTFSLCGQVKYDTDILHRIQTDSGERYSRIHGRIKEQLTGPSVAHSIQEISLTLYDDEFYRCFIELSGLIQLNIICRDITVEKVKLVDQHFFWQENKD